MKNPQQKPDTILVRSPKKISKKQNSQKEEKKDSPEEMIRKLQGIFCRGRYQSWVSYELRHHK